MHLFINSPLYCTLTQQQQQQQQLLLHLVSLSLSSPKKAFMGKLFLALLSFLTLFYSVLSCPYCPTPVPPIVLPSPPPPPPPPPPPSTLVPCPPPPPKGGPGCPIDTLKLDACVNILGGLVNLVIGGEGQATDACCPVLEGVADLDAALCLCTTIKANLLNINILLPIALEVLIDCGKHIPSDYQCPAY